MKKLLAFTLAVLLSLGLALPSLGATLEEVEKELISEVNSARIGFFDRLNMRAHIRNALKQLHEEYGDDVDLPAHLIREAVRAMLQGVDADNFGRAISGLAMVLRDGADQESLTSLVNAAVQGRIPPRAFAELLDAAGKIGVSRESNRELTDLASLVESTYDNPEAANALADILETKVSGEEIAALIQSLLEEGKTGEELAEAVVEKATVVAKEAQKKNPTGKGVKPEEKIGSDSQDNSSETESEHSSSNQSTSSGAPSGGSNNADNSSGGLNNSGRPSNAEGRKP